MKYYTLNKLGSEGERTQVLPMKPVRVKMPFSEVCMHLKIAEQYHDVLLVVNHVNGHERASVRILKEGWKSVEETDTLEITTGEAGILVDYMNGEA